MKRRVVITGLGAVTPIGNTVEEFWNGVRKGACGIGTITKFDTAEYKVHLAGEVKGFVAKERMDFKAARRMGTFSQYAVAAAKEAFADAGISMENEDPFRVGVLVGSGVGDLNACEQAKAKIDAGNQSRVNPFTVPVMIANMAAGNVAIALGAKGKCTSVVTACATGTHCIGDAFRAIQYNDADICVAGGAESAITPVGVAGFSALTALSESEDPLRASIPFDKDRNGFVMGEGAGILVLEELEHAKQRGAKIYAEVVGYGATCDAYHITSPLEDGSGAARAMELAMEEAGVKPEKLLILMHTERPHITTICLKRVRSGKPSVMRQTMCWSTRRNRWLVICSARQAVWKLLSVRNPFRTASCIRRLEQRKQMRNAI